MAKLQSLSVIALLCFISAVAVVVHAHTREEFTVEGRVYCDTCRAGFVTTVTEFVPDAKVKIECHNRTTNKLTLEREGVTDASGTYRIMVPNDHEDDICEVVLVSSPMEGCKEAKKPINRARILLTNNNGISSEIRYANPLGFLKDKPLPCCAELLVKYIMSDEATF
ncbi:pollen-specific protein C13-like [Magnolia sinica]|uniref:pollen-specific protein C13-like n=1 Tax=Magnolia sinica TaxID=86752 RepID=UPI0026593EAC|nr:pollen-specific protein C13-like [Magnolia sinica]